MKKLILLFAVILTTSIAFAQSPLNLAVKLGGNYSIINSDYNTFPDLKDKSQFTYSAGLMARLKIKKFSLQAEALYVTKKGEIQDDTKVIDAIDIDFATIDFPILVGYKLVDLKVVKLRANAGVIPSITASKSGSLDKDSYKDSYLSAAAGLSLDIPLFVFDVRYQHGLGDFYEVSENFGNGTVAKGNISNNLVTFSVGYKFL